MTCGSDFHGKTKSVIKTGMFAFVDGYEHYLRASMQKLDIAI